MSGTPGPNNVMLATSGANFGYRKTLPHLLGINSGLFALTAVICAGLGAVFTRYPVIHLVLKYAGAVYLAYLAWKLAGASLARGETAAKPLSFAEGAAFQLVNPKSWIKAVTIATFFMPPGIDALAGALLVSIVGLVIGFPLISCWTLFGVGMRRFLDSPRRLKLFNLLMGLSLVVLAVSLVT
ncbi:MAG: LysE family translocator [Pseudomonadota bacterium]